MEGTPTPHMGIDDLLSELSTWDASAGNMHLSSDTVACGLVAEPSVQLMLMQWTVGECAAQGRR